jgi:HK97 family phage portal protein
MASKKKKVYPVQRSWESPAVSITNPGVSDLFGFVPSSSGVEVNRHSVYALPALLHGIDLIASTVGRIDCGVYKRGRDGTKSRDTEHPADYLLMRRPNEWQTPFEFRRELASDAVLGNAYAYVARDDQGKPTDLVILDPAKTWPVVVRYSDDVGKMRVYYVHTIQGKDIILDASDVIHIKGRVRHDTGLVGRPLLDAAKEVLGLSTAVIRYASKYFANNGLPAMIVEMPTFMKDNQILQQFREGLDANHRGVEQAHKTMILQGGATVSKGYSQLDNESAQLLESRMMTLTDISLILGLPGSFLGSKQNTSYGSLEQDSLNLLVHSFSHWFTNLEQQFDRLLLTEIEKSRGIRWIEFTRQQLLEADHETTTNNWIALVNNGLCLPNDACAALNLEPLDEEWNKPRLPSGVTIQGEEPPAPAPQVPQVQQQAQEGTPQAPQGDEAPQDDTSVDLNRSDDIERCGGEGGTPGPCPTCANGKCGKDGDDKHQARQAAVSKTLGGVIDRSSALSDKQKAEFKEQTAAVVANMPPTALDRFGSNVKKIRYHADQKSMTEKIVSEDDHLREKLAGKNVVIKGSYERSTRQLDLDGGGSFEGKAASVGELHAHEFTHAIDGPSHELSNSKEWQHAWASELKGGNPSKYASVKASEGFAEFGRMAYGQGKGAEELAKSFPKCAAYWQSKGLLK